MLQNQEKEERKERNEKERKKRSASTQRGRASQNLGSQKVPEIEMTFVEVKKRLKRTKDETTEEENAEERKKVSFCIKRIRLVESCRLQRATNRKDIRRSAEKAEEEKKTKKKQKRKNAE